MPLISIDTMPDNENPPATKYAIRGEVIIIDISVSTAFFTVRVFCLPVSPLRVDVSLI